MLLIFLFIYSNLIPHQQILFLQKKNCIKTTSLEFCFVFDSMAVSMRMKTEERKICKKKKNYCLRTYIRLVAKTIRFIIDKCLES